MISFKPGRLYKFTLSDGRKLVLRFEGLGSHNRAVWVEPESGSEIEPLPPYTSVVPA